MFNINPIVNSKTILETKRIDLLCCELLNNFNYDIFVELLEKNKLTDDIFIGSITQTFTTSSSDFKYIIKLI